MSGFALQAELNAYLLSIAGAGRALARTAAAMRARRILCARADRDFPTLTAPLLLDTEQAAYLRHVSERVVALLTTETSRYVESESKLFDRLRLPPDLRPLVAANLGVTLARCDYLWSDRGWRLVEVNISAAVGGLDAAEYTDSVAGDAVLRPFIERRGLYGSDPMRALVRGIRRVCSVAQPVVAIVDAPEFFEVYAEAFDRMTRCYASYGFRTLLCEPGELFLRDGSVYVRGVRIDVVHREFLLEDVLDDLAPARTLMAAARAGRITLVSGFREELFGSKAMLAVLGDAARRGALAGGDTDLVRRVIPRTELLVDSFDGGREDWVIKPSVGGSGDGVTLGPAMDDASFQAAVRSAVASPAAWVAQRFVSSTPVRLPVLRGEELAFDYFQIHPSVFIIDGRAAGFWLRAAPGPTPRLIDLAGGARYGGILSPRA